jgi:hypothetical protein
MFIDTLERCRKTFGPTHPGTLTCTQSLSSLYRSTGRIDEAIALLTTARAIALDAAGPVSPAVVDLSMMLAIATTEAWRSEEALALFAEIAPSVRTLYPEDHPSMRSLVRAWNAAIERLDDPTLAAKAIAELAAHEAAVGDTAGAE